MVAFFPFIRSRAAGVAIQSRPDESSIWSKTMRARQGVRRFESGDLPIVETHQADASSQQEIPVGAFADGKDLRVWHPLLFDEAARVALKPYQAAFMETDPDISGAVLKNAVGFIAGEGLRACQTR